MTFSLGDALRLYSRRTWDRQDLDKCTKLGLIATKVAASVGYALGRRLPASARGAETAACR
jgi:hypothetical protein